MIVVGLATYLTYVQTIEQSTLWLARRLALYVAVMGMLVSIALLIIAGILVRQFTSPLRELTQTVTSISEGNLDASAPVLSNDEVGTLAQAFNSMTEKLRQTMAGLEAELRERKQAESAMSESEEKFRTVFESSPIAICVTALEDGRLLDANYAYWDLTGYNPDESIGKTSEELKLWSSIEERNKFVKNLKLKGSVYNPDDSFLDESGDEKHVISFFRLVKIGDEERVISMFYDMSMQKQTMQALQQSEARVRALLEAVPDMILELTLDGLVINMIPPKGMEEAMPPENFVGKQVYEILSETAASQTLFAVERAVRSNHMNVFEFETKMSGTVRVMESRVVANATDTAIMMIRDVTQRKWIESEREELINELEVKNKESETLRESLASVVTTFDINEVLERILDQIKLVIPYDTASVWRVEGEWQTLIIGRSLPPEIDGINLKFRMDTDNSSGPVIRGERAFVLNNNVQDELPDFKGPHSYVNSWLAVPLKTKGNIIGLIALDGRQKNQFDQHHAGLAVTFADQVAVALENARLFSDLQAELDERRKLIAELEIKNVESETLRESTAIVAATLDIPLTVQRILEQIKRVVQYDSASVWLYQDGNAVMVGANGLPPEVERDGKFPISETEPDYAFFDDRTKYILFEDIQEQYPIFREPPQNYIHSWLGVPLRARGTVTGFISLDSRMPRKFTEHDAEIARTFAEQVSVAVENARLFSDLQAELEERSALIGELETKNIESETLRESTAIVVSTLEISEIVQRILEQIKRVVRYDSASVWLYQDEYAYMMGSNGLPAGAELPGKYKIGEKEPDYAFWKESVPYILLDDIQEHYPEFREHPKNYIHGWLTIPLRVRGKLTGFISLDSLQTAKFTVHDAELALTFADQVSIALENARLFSNLQAELEERRRLIAELEIKNVESETLRESTAIVASTLEISESVRRLLEQIKRVVQYDSASVWLYHEEKAVMVGSIGLPSEMEGPREYIRSRDAPDHRLWDNEDNTSYVLLADTHDDYPIFHTPPINYIHSWLGIPLRARGKLIGFVGLDSRTPGKFTRHDAEIALALAEQVSIALENARLFSDLQAELEERKKLIAELEIKNVESETLRESTTIIASTLEISESVQRILEQIKRVVQYDSTSVWLYHGEKAVRMGAIGLPPEMDTMGEYLRNDDSPDYGFWSSDNEAAYILLDDLQEHYPIFRKPPLNYIRGWLGIPLRVRGKLIGFIALDSHIPGKFTEHDAEMAVSLAEQVSIALENARLFSDLQTELDARKELITELESKNAELERFTYTVSHDLKSPLFTIRGFLGYLEKDALDGNHERFKTDMKRIVDATNKMHNLLNDLLELSRVGRVGNEPEAIPFEDLAREAVEIVQGRIAERGITIRVDSNLPTVHGDRIRLLEVVQNLVDNAAKFMGDQKEPRIDIGQDGKEDGKPIFYVRDNGIGISPEHHERVFGLFNKLDVKADGTGIGLALVRRIIEVHGGRIWVESEVGKGATFYFTIPLVNPDEPNEI